MNFEELIDRASGRPSGFDYTRTILAILIIAFHSIVTCYGALAQSKVVAGPFGWIFNMILPMFFALSGFLVTGSLQRAKTVRKFLWLRVIRIYPALIFDTLLAALIIGPVFTTLTWDDYFNSGTFWVYLLNSIGIIHYYLPGVFESNPVDKINAQLWTIPIELECYIALGIMALLKIQKKPLIFCFITISTCAAYGALGFIGSPINMRRGLVPGTVLVLCFLAGVSLFLCKNLVRFSKKYFIFGCILLILCVIIPEFIYFSPIPVAYVTCYIGCLNPNINSFVRRFDISYGIYLYGYPIQQVVVYVNGGVLSWYSNIAITLPIVLIVASLSLFYIERPIQRWMK